MKNKLYALVPALALLLCAVSAKADTSIVNFPDLPSSTAWISGLTTVFVGAAGLGLGIKGLTFVIAMISAGLAKRRK